MIEISKRTNGLNRAISGLILSLLVLFLLSADSAMAASALPGSNNESAYNAQYVGCGANNCGAMWFSNSSDAANANVTIPAGYTDSTIDIKLYGAVYAHGYSDAKYYGNNVHVLTRATSGVSPYTDFSGYTYTPITFNGSYTLDSIDRGYGIGAGYWSVGWENGGKTATLDIAEFKRLATNNGNGSYTQTVHVWRCYGQSYSGDPRSCYSDPSTIALVDENEQGENVRFSSQSSVSVAGTTKTSAWEGNVDYGTYETTEKDTVVSFSHSMKRDNDTTYDVSAAYNVSQSQYDAKNIVSGSWSGTSTSGVQVTASSLTVSLGTNESATVCQTIGHDRNVKLTISASGTVTSTEVTSQGSSSACVTIQRNGPPPTPASGDYSGKTTVKLNGITADDGWDTTTATITQNVNSGNGNVEFTYWLRFNGTIPAEITKTEALNAIKTYWWDNVGTPKQQWTGHSSSGVVVSPHKEIKYTVALGHTLNISQELSYEKNISYEYDIDGNVSNVSRSGIGHAAAHATVRYPYNFRTTATAKITNTGAVVYAGESVVAKFDIQKTDRTNQAVQNSEYSTETPSDTNISYAHFLVPASVSKDSVQNLIQGSTDSLSSSGSLCDFVRTYGRNYQCEEVKTQGDSLNKQITYRVPDVEPGMKYCVISGISHADSHNLPDSDVLNASDGLNGFALSSNDTDPTTSPFWRVSEVSCRTIAKKPSTQVWGGGVYSSGDIQATTSVKVPSAQFTDQYDTSNERIFGSWTEYLIMNGNNTTNTGFASASTLGYANSISKPSSFCRLSNLSVSNSICSTSKTGASGVNFGNDLASRLESRLTLSEHGADQQPAGSNLATASYARIASGADYVYVDGNAEISGSSLRTSSGQTRIIHVDGTLAINSNICSGGGTCNNANSSLILSNRNSESFGQLSDIPQTIIFADNIQISPDVTQIDAWLISSGNINTCNVAEITADNCKNPLIINGPLITDSLSLNRSGGAWPGQSGSLSGLANVNFSSTTLGSIAPAEIINFRADNYLWILQQITSAVEPTTSYIRELAPRY